MHLTHTLIMMYAQLKYYHLCLLPNTLHAFDTHTMRAACPKNILSSTLSAKKLHVFDTQKMRAAWPTNILSSMPSP